MSNFNFYLGLDIAKRSDYSALVIAEKPFWSVRHNTWMYLTDLTREEAEKEYREECVEQRRMAESSSLEDWPEDWKLRVLSAQRWPKQTTYPQVAEDVGRLFRGMDSGLVQIALLVDVTGQGDSMSDLLRKDGLPAIGLTWGGIAQKPNWDEEDKVGKVNVPKGDLVTRTKMLFELEQIHIVPFPEEKALIDELYSYQMKTNTVTGHESWGAASNTYDDLVSALMMACWFAQQGEEQGVPYDVIGKKLSSIGYELEDARKTVWEYGIGDGEPYTGYGVDEEGGGQLHQKFGAPWLIR